MFLHCLGNISNWSVIVSQEIDHLKVNHTFLKQSSLSQYEIMTTNGILKMSIPTIKKTRNGLYENIQIDYNSNWRTEQWRGIENAYVKSPFFLYYGYKIESVFKEEYTSLLELNFALHRCICKCIKVDSRQIDKETNIHFHKEAKNSVKPYPQVYDAKREFESDLSILDLLFNLGPETHDYLLRL